jgi:hypothetical protein
MHPQHTYRVKSLDVARSILDILVHWSGVPASILRREISL